MEIKSRVMCTRTARASTPQRHGVTAGTLTYYTSEDSVSLQSTIHVKSETIHKIFFAKVELGCTLLRIKRDKNIIF